MVTIKIFNSRLEADIAKGFLESSGIFAILSADDQGGLRPSMGFISGVELRVVPEDVEKAKQALESV